MKTYYLMIVADGEISSATRFYKVGVGTSKRDASCLHFLQMWSNARGHYFAKINADVDDFQQRIAKSIGLQVYDLQKTTCTVERLTKYIKEFGETPSIPPTSKQQTFFRQIIQPAAYFQGQINVIRHAEAYERQKPKVHASETSCKQEILIKTTPRKGV